MTKQPKVSIIAIAGGSGSGKTTLAKLLEKEFGSNAVLILAQDYYYKDQSHLFDGDGGSVNFDHPDSLDFELLASHLKLLKSGRPIDCPSYDFVTHKRLATTTHCLSKPIVVVEGTLLLSQKAIRDLVDKSYFIEVPEPLRLERRIKRDVMERGRHPDGVLKQYNAQVKPMYDLFVDPSKAFANAIVTNDDYTPCLNEIRVLLKTAI